MVSVKKANEHRNTHVKNEPLTVELVEKELDQAIYKAIRYDQLPWVEAVIPYYINERMIEEIFEKYKNSGWYSIYAKAFTETKCEDGGFSTNYRVISYTKFIFCDGSAMEYEVEKFYGKDLKNTNWKIFDSETKKTVAALSFFNS